MSLRPLLWHDGVTPAPGSALAVEWGCTCPVLDNSHGRGAWFAASGEQLWIQRDDCPIHPWDEATGPRR